ncbi:hypothetical protein PG994_009660 [Apiospora phragmitis]|uniref:Uncharacterized protein n=1 Tax=Apiospora phragmitis TaxID=2905665 RepID=A0ABR1U6T3_9PEZI
MKSLSLAILVAFAVRPSAAAPWRYPGELPYPPEVTTPDSDCIPEREPHSIDGPLEGTVFCDGGIPINTTHTSADYTPIVHHWTTTVAAPKKGLPRPLDRARLRLGSGDKDGLVPGGELLADTCVAACTEQRRKAKADGMEAVGLCRFFAMRLFTQPGNPEHNLGHVCTLYSESWGENYMDVPTRGWSIPEMDYYPGSWTASYKYVVRSVPFYF